MVEHAQIGLDAGQKPPKTLFEGSYSLRCVFSWHGFIKEANFAGVRVNLDNLESQMCEFVFELNAAVDQGFNESFFTSGITGNPLPPQFLVALPAFPLRFCLARAAFFKAT